MSLRSRCIPGVLMGDRLAQDSRDVEIRDIRDRYAEILIELAPVHSASIDMHQATRARCPCGRLRMTGRKSACPGQMTLSRLHGTHLPAGFRGTFPKRRQERIPGPPQTFRGPPSSDPALRIASTASTTGREPRKLEGAGSPHRK